MIIRGNFTPFSLNFKRKKRKKFFEQKLYFFLFLKQPNNLRQLLKNNVRYLRENELK